MLQYIILCNIYYTCIIFSIIHYSIVYLMKFCICLYVYLICKLEYFINELVKNQKEFSRNVTSEIKEINHSINDLRIYIASNGRKS